MSEVYVVRHGQAAFGTDDYDRLTEVGWEQSRLLGEYCHGRDLHFDAVYTGSMRRVVLIGYIRNPCANGKYGGKLPFCA